ncbi:MAG: hypothetical protein ACTSYI_11605 [Promethearchaeota archaeon]
MQKTIKKSLRDSPHITGVGLLMHFIVIDRLEIRKNFVFESKLMEYRHRHSKFKVNRENFVYLELIHGNWNIHMSCVINLPITHESLQNYIWGMSQYWNN